MNSVYTDSSVLVVLINVFNLIFLYLNFFIPYFVYHKTIKSFQIGFVFQLHFIILINIFLFSFYNIPEVLIVELIILYGYLIFKSLAHQNSSIKWVNFSFLLLVIFILFSYNLFAFIVNTFSLDVLNKYDVADVKIVYKSFYSLFTDFYNVLHLKGLNITISNDVFFKRLYLFYYIFSSFALMFWTIVYVRVIKKHNFKL